MTPYVICETSVKPLVAKLSTLKWLPGGEPGTFAMISNPGLKVPGQLSRVAAIGKAAEKFAVKALPIIASVLLKLEGYTAGEVLVCRMVPGQKYLPHRDYLERDCRLRVHIPIVTNPKATFTINRKKLHMEVGNAYAIDPTDLHSVINGGTTDRIHLVFNALGG